MQSGRRVARTCRVPQAVADLRQELVTAGVTEPVVDLLEVIEVDVQEREHLVGPATQAHDGVLDAVLEQLAVGQIGQRIVEGAHARLLVEPALSSRMAASVARVLASSSRRPSNRSLVAVVNSTEPMARPRTTRGRMTIERWPIALR